VCKWHYDKWRGVYFLRILSSQVSEIEKSKTAATIFSDFIFFNFMNFEISCVNMSIYWNLKKLIWTFCVQVEGDNFLKNQNCHSLFYQGMGQ